MPSIFPNENSNIRKTVCQCSSALSRAYSYAFQKHDGNRVTMPHLIYLIILCAASVFAGQAHSETYNDRFISEKSPVIAFTDARVIDGTGLAPNEECTVVISDGLILPSKKSCISSR